MRAAWLVASLLLLVSAVAWGQGGLRNASWVGYPGDTPRSLGMGGLTVGMGDGAAAWRENPAGLGWELYNGEAKVQAPRAERGCWLCEKLAWWEGDDCGDDYGGTLSAYQPLYRRGWGAGITYESGESTGVGVGYGQRFGESRFSWGVNGVANFPQDGSSEWLFNGGFMYSPNDRTRVGLLIGDLSNQTKDGPVFSLGASSLITPRLTVGADILDLGGRLGSHARYDFGAEYSLGAKNEWKLRAGAEDSTHHEHLTLGVGYAWNRWRADVGFKDGNSSDTWAAGLTHDF